MRHQIEQLSELFGNYKAEYLRERIFDLYTQPAYFPELETGRPCALIGGRGTGKTTVLRSLSYEGRFALSKYSVNLIDNWSYFGFYLRVDTNRVTAFRGPDLRADLWTRLFAHYINLLLCGQVLKFLHWYESKLPHRSSLPADICRLVALSLRLGEADTVADLLTGLREARVRFEAFLNNLKESDLPPISMQGAPIDELMEAVSALPQFENKYFFFLIDEYENFLEDQQVVLNTLIKHSGSHHTFKIGVRELGWRVRHTMNPTERLTSPADFALISIADKLKGDRFANFAAEILNQRMQNLSIPEVKMVPDIKDLLPGLSEEQEAEELGIIEKLATLVSERRLSQVMAEKLRLMPPLEAYFALFWSTDRRPLENVIDERESDQEAWKTRFGNYKHSLLFTIRSRKSGIRKYYAGWDTFVLLSGSNIRYLIELVDQTLVSHANAGGALDQAVNWEIQTRAAEGVGRKNVSELEGLSVHGAQLTKLVLGLGRIFQVMAQEPHEHAPEVNQFHLPDVGELPLEVSDLLTDGVMHLALVRSTSSKMERAELKEYDYSIHPIFTPFFVFSHRKKRKMILSPDQILGLVRFPTATIREILAVHTRSTTSELPEQLLLFESYYGSHS